MVALPAPRDKAPPVRAADMVARLLYLPATPEMSLADADRLAAAIRLALRLQARQRAKL